MKINIHSVRNAQHQLETAQRFQKGLLRHNINSTIGHPVNGKADLNVFWGVRFASKYTQGRGDFIVMERAYFEDRFQFISLGYNGLNNRGDFLNKNMPDDRWRKHFDDGRLEDWKTGGDHVLITTQVKGDMSLTHVDVDYQKIINQIKENTDLPIKIKHHPLRPSNWGQLKGAEVINSKMPIEEAFENAKVVVTINSNSGVDAILKGVPVINIDHGSMVWDVAMQNDFSQINNPPNPDRSQWAHNTSYCQWLPEEIESGEAWEHLKAFYEEE